MTDQEQGKKFDPSRHLTKVSGKDYLEVKWRLAWFRADHPDGVIITEMVSHHDNEAVFRAEVIIPNGGGSSTGWGSEDARGFGDYLEKAETKAIGRALAALGFGIQHSYEFDDTSTGRRDAPSARQQTERPNRGTDTRKAPSSPQRANTGQTQTEPVSGGAKPGQVTTIRKIAGDLGMSGKEIMRLIDTTLPGTAYTRAEELTEDHAAQLITALHKALEEKNTR